MAFTVSRAIRWWAWDRPDRVALDYEGEPLTYAELNAWAARVGAWLVEQGVRPGDRVSTIAANSLDYAVLIVGIMYAGGINAPLTFRASARELRRSLDLLAPALLFSDAERKDCAGEALGAQDRHKLRSLDIIRALRDAPEPAAAPYEPNPDDPLFIIGTSGSTGFPKGVVYTHGSTMAYSAEFALMEPATGNGGSILAAGPYSSSSGTLLLMQFLSVGATIHAQNRFTPEIALRLLQEKHITTFLASVIFWERIAALPEFEQADLSSIKFAQISGARVNPSLLERYREKGLVLRQAYGCTEAGGAWAARDRTALTQPDTCGPGAMFSDYRIMLPDGTIAPPGEPGEILVRSAGLTVGYWNDPEQTAKAYQDGWLHTGDRGVMDEDGNLTFIDRIKDIIISGGLNISAMEVEGAIAEMEGVDEVVVIAAQDADFGETPLAIIHGDPDRLDPQDIVAHCRTALASYKVPRYIALEPEPLPRLPSTKINKVLLREKYREAASFLEKIR
ncbi:MAG: class I adenylate-forming enzyme family protein [Sphingobium sp.]